MNHRAVSPDRFSFGLPKGVRDLAAFAGIALFVATLFAVAVSTSGCTGVYDPSSNSLRVAVMGKITGETGEAIEGVVVSVAGMPQIKTVTSAFDGKYVLTDVPLGEIQIMVEKGGFQSVTRLVLLEEPAARENENFILSRHLTDIFVTRYGDDLAQICFRTVNPVPSYVEYGENGSYGKNAYLMTERTRHGVFIKNLVKSVEYTYRVKYDGASYSNPSTFRLDDSHFPPAPFLKSPLEVTHTTVKLGWTREDDLDFASYRVYRSIDSPASGEGIELSVITDRDTTTFTDQGLTPNATYYYRVITLFKNGLATASREMGIETEDYPNEAPGAVTLKNVTERTHTSFTLDWSMSEDTDFESYRVYYSKTEGVSTASTLGSKVTDRSLTTVFVKGLEKSTMYYLKVFVFDSGGLSAGSNEIMARTDAYNSMPMAVHLYPGEDVDTSSCRLKWTKSVSSDFLRYGIYRSTMPGVDTDAFLAAEITEYETISFIDSRLTEGLLYYYRVMVFDDTELYSRSNEIAVVLKNESPTRVSIDMTNADVRSITISWDRSPDSDFDHYAIYRSESQYVAAEPTDLIKTVFIREDTTFTDDNDGAGLTAGRTYYYRVYVYDKGGMSTGSPLGVATTIDKTAFMGDVNGIVVISRANSPLHIVGDVTVTGSSTLRILEGVAVEVEANSDAVGTGDPMKSEIIVNGDIQVMGVAGLPVLFESSLGTAASPGDWGGIILEGGARNSVIEYASLSHATTAVDCGATGVRIEKVLAADCSGNGIRNRRGDTKISFCEITRCQGAGISVTDTSIFFDSNPLVTDCNITDNTGMGISGGGGVIGAAARVGGVYFARNNGSAAIDTTGQAGGLPKGLKDGTYDTDSDSDVIPQQIDNVDTINALVYDPVDGAGPF